MRAIVVGGGIAGLGAAFRLREAGHEVVLLEKESEPGGRCRSVLWNGVWAVTGALAYLGAETWSDVVDVLPELAGTTVLDSFISRHPEAICKRPKGYISSIKAFRDLGPLPHVAFCGDYLTNSTVGQSHWSGLTAADDLMSRMALQPS